MKKIFIGLTCILLGVWFYTALSTFSIDDTSFPKQLVIREGTERTAIEVAEALSKEVGFDLEGAYKSGYAAMDVVEYLMQQPHKLAVTFHEGGLYEGRKTVAYAIPLAICILLIIAGLIIAVSGLKSGKS